MSRPTIDGAYDFMVIGAGSAGCAVAARLAQARGTRVLLLEAGGRDHNPLHAVPAVAAAMMGRRPYDWNYRTETQPELGDRSLAWLGGKVLGGGSSVNGMVYLRGSAHDYDRWRDVAGCDGWAFEDVLGYFRKLERSDRGETEHHGGAGPVSIRRGMTAMPIAGLFLEAMREAGFDLVDDLNAQQSEGFGLYDATIDAGQRASSARSYLRGLDRAGQLDILTDASAQHILFEGRRARGVSFRRGGVEHVVRADGEIVLCAGTVNSAQLLMLSGIGPADALRAHSIDVLHASPEVGANLQNHVAYTMAYACSAPVTAYRYLRPLPGLLATARYALRRDGILSQLGTPAGGILRSQPDSDFPDTQVILGAGLPAPDPKRWLSPFPVRHGFTVMTNQGRPFSRGEVRLRSPQPHDAPIIEPRYFSDPRDLTILTHAVARMRAAMRIPALARVIESELRPGPDVQDEQALRHAIRQGATSYYHAVGTCRMGGDARSVVDLALRVRGVEGLRVADASVIPLLVNGNTAAAAMMIGERAADFILDRA